MELSQTDFVAVRTDSPEIHLMGLTSMKSVNAISAVHKAWANQQHIIDLGCG
jgi:hypothetical protein